jgi:hypothetical protein
MRCCCCDTILEEYELDKEYCSNCETYIRQVFDKDTVDPDNPFKIVDLALFNERF